MIARNKDSVDANASFCAPRQKVARELDVSVLNPRVCSQNSADNRETSEKRILRTSPAECEGAIEELSKAMEEGFSAMLDGLVEDFDKPGGIGDMIDKSFERYECFEKIDKLEKKLKSDECVCGKWASEKGESMIFRDSNTNRLTFEELVDDSGYLHGWLDRTSDGWQARVALDDIDEEPWYSPSCGKRARIYGSHTCSTVVGDEDRDPGEVF